MPPFSQHCPMFSRFAHKGSHEPKPMLVTSMHTISRIKRQYCQTNPPMALPRHFHDRQTSRDERYRLPFENRPTF